MFAFLLRTQKCQNNVQETEGRSWNKRKYSICSQLANLIQDKVQQVHVTNSKKAMEKDGQQHSK